MSEKDWNALTHLQRQKLFSTKDIMILGSESEGVVFDRDLLLSVAGSMDRVVTVQGMCKGKTKILSLIALFGRPLC
jgi:hypothetical protein